MDLKTFRKTKNLSQAEFGSIAGVGQVAVSQWENEKLPDEPAPSNARKLMRYFDGQLTWEMIYGYPLEQGALPLEQAG